MGVQFLWFVFRVSHPEHPLPSIRCGFPRGAWARVRSEKAGREGILRGLAPRLTIVLTSPPTRTHVSVSLVFLPKHDQGLPPSAII